jgi:hypothetical protein
MNMSVSVRLRHKNISGHHSHIASTDSLYLSVVIDFHLSSTRLSSLTQFMEAIDLLRLMKQQQLLLSDRLGFAVVPVIWECGSQGGQYGGHARRFLWMVGDVMPFTRLTTTAPQL